MNHARRSHVADSESLAPSFLYHTLTGESVRRFSALRYGYRKGVFVHLYVAVAEFARHFGINVHARNELS